MPIHFSGVYSPLGRLLSIPIAFKLRPRQVLTIDLARLYGQCLGFVALARFCCGFVDLHCRDRHSSRRRSSPQWSRLPRTACASPARRHPCSWWAAVWASMFFPWLTGLLYERVGPPIVPVMIAVSGTVLLLLILCCSGQKIPGEKLCQVGLRDHNQRLIRFDLRWTNGRSFHGQFPACLKSPTSRYNPEYENCYPPHWCAALRQDDPAAKSAGSVYRSRGGILYPRDTQGWPPYGIRDGHAGWQYWHSGRAYTCPARRK